MTIPLTVPSAIPPEKRGVSSFFMDADADDRQKWQKDMLEMQRMAEDAKMAAEATKISLKRQQLAAMVTVVEMINSQLYTGNSWNALMRAYAIGKPLTLKDDVEMKDLKKALDELTAAFTGLETADLSRPCEDDELHEGLPIPFITGGGSKDIAAKVNAKLSAGTTALAAPAMDFAV